MAANPSATPYQPLDFLRTRFLTSCRLTVPICKVRMVTVHRPGAWRRVHLSTWPRSVVGSGQIQGEQESAEAGPGRAGALGSLSAAHGGPTARAAPLLLALHCPFWECRPPERPTTHPCDLLGENTWECEQESHSAPAAFSLPAWCPGGERGEWGVSSQGLSRDLLLWDIFWYWDLKPCGSCRSCFGFSLELVFQRIQG